MVTKTNSSSIGGSNTGSCANLTSYLDKEQENGWFNATENGIDTEKVTAEIDGQGRGGIKKQEWGFIEIEYNPSQAEQQQIIYQSTGISDVSDWKQLTQGEQEKVKESFKEYVREAQDIQAKNYGREKVKSGEDLKYYAKIETQRKYKGTDQAVKNGEVRQGQLKEGLNMHAHIVQHRKTVDKKTKLSPQANAKKSSKNNPSKAGFDRNGFYNKLEQSFDKRYNYERSTEQTFEWKKANKLNRLEVKVILEKRTEQPHREHRQKIIEAHRESREKAAQQQEQKRSNNKGFSR